MITFSSPTLAICSWLEDEAIQKYKDKRVGKLAFDCTKYGHEYLKSLPIGANVDIQSKKSQKKIQRDLKQHVQNKIDTNVYGFDPITDFLILAVIGGIIGWIVGKLLDLFWDHRVGIE